jgi:hypothetical protein
MPSALRVRRRKAVSFAMLTIRISSSVNCAFCPLTRR